MQASFQGTSLCWRHAVQLSRTVESSNPLNTLGSIQLSTGLCVVDEADIVQDTRLNDPHAVLTAEAIAPSEEGCACAVDE